jgi:hypothetical protein
VEGIKDEKPTHDSEYIIAIHEQQRQFAVGQWSFETKAVRN